MTTVAVEATVFSASSASAGSSVSEHEALNQEVLALTALSCSTVRKVLVTAVS
jgi:hypothetical protein